MSSPPSKPDIGKIAWVDLTVEDAETVRDFYAQVVGWKPEGVSMDGYEDFNMTAPGDGQAAAGVCHRRGNNTDFPAQWLMYVIVEDLDASLERCRELGGEVLAGPKGEAGKPRYAVIRDPAGAVMALYMVP